MKSRSILMALIVACTVFSGAANAQSYAITNAKIVTVSGAPIDRGTIVVRNGLIEAVGANVKPPADARIFDAAGLTVYPGFIDTLTTLGLPSTAAPGGQGRGQGAAAPPAFPQAQPQQQAAT